MNICPACGHDLDEDGLLKRDGFVIDPRGSVTFDGRSVDVQPSGLTILWVLGSSPGQVLSATELIDAAGFSPSVKGLQVQINRLRNALASAHAPQVVQTLRSRGYRWELPGSYGSVAAFHGPSSAEGDLSDAQWAHLAPVFTRKQGSHQPLLATNRPYLNGILYLLRTGVAWSKMPRRYGKWNSVFICSERWAERGVWDDLIKPLVDLGITSEWHRDTGNVGGDRTTAAPRGNDAGLRQILVDHATGLREKPVAGATVRNAYLAYVETRRLTSDRASV